MVPLSPGLSVGLVSDISYLRQKGCIIELTVTIDKKTHTSKYLDPDHSPNSIHKITSNVCNDNEACLNGSRIVRFQAEVFPNKKKLSHYISDDIVGITIFEDFKDIYIQTYAPYQWLNRGKRQNMKMLKGQILNPKAIGVPGCDMVCLDNRRKTIGFLLQGGNAVTRSRQSGFSQPSFTH